MQELYLHLLVYPWPAAVAVVALVLVLSQWRLVSLWQLLDVALGGLLAALLSGTFTLTWGMPVLDTWTSLAAIWKWPLFLGAGLLLGLSMPREEPAGRMWPGLALGFVLVRARLTDANVVLQPDAWPCAGVALLWLASRVSRPSVLVPRLLGSGLVLATPALVAAQLGLGRLTAGATLAALVVGATLRRRGPW